MGLVKDLERKDYLHLSEWSQCNHRVIIKKRRRSRVREGDVTTEAERVVILIAGFY